jgi:eukaryotic-like serine/threonine-protein kinase
VYVAPVDDPGLRTMVSSGGGVSPRWRADGRELYFLGPGSGIGSRAALQVVEIRTEASLDLGGPRVLFEVDAPVHQASYDIAPDGSAFLVNHAIEDDTEAPIQVMVNWPALIR